MKTLSFYSDRIQKFVGIIMTCKKVIYITENEDIVSIDRDECWHFTEDGLDRAREYFEDSRYWVNG